MTRLPVDIKQDVKCGFMLVLVILLEYVLYSVVGLRNNFVNLFFFFSVK